MYLEQEQEKNNGYIPFPILLFFDFSVPFYFQFLFHCLLPISALKLFSF